MKRLQYSRHFTMRWDTSVLYLAFKKSQYLGVTVWHCSGQWVWFRSLWEESTVVNKMTAPSPAWCAVMTWPCRWKWDQEGEAGWWKDLVRWPNSPGPRLSNCELAVTREATPPLGWDPVVEFSRTDSWVQSWMEMPHLASRTGGTTMRSRWGFSELRTGGRSPLQKSLQGTVQRGVWLWGNQVRLYWSSWGTVTVEEIPIPLVQQEMAYCNMTDLGITGAVSYPWPGQT